MINIDKNIEIADEHKCIATNVTCIWQEHSREFFFTCECSSRSHVLSLAGTEIKRFNSRFCIWIFQIEENFGNLVEFSDSSKRRRKRNIFNSTSQPKERNYQCNEQIALIGVTLSKRMLCEFKTQSNQLRENYESAIKFDSIKPLSTKALKKQDVHNFFFQFSFPQTEWWSRYHTDTTDLQSKLININELQNNGKWTC